MKHLRTLLAAAAISALSFTPTLAVGAATAASPAPQIEQQKVQKVHLVMDSSGSMAEPTGGGKTRIDAAKDALNSLVDTAPEDTQLGLRVYGSSATAEGSEESCRDSKLVVPIGTGNRDALRKEIDKYTPVGWTPISYALEQAGEDIGSPGENEEHTIVLVSDGEETCVPDPCPVADKLAAKGINLKINVVGLNVDGKAREQLQCIADHGNGTYFDAENADELENAINDAVMRSGQHFAQDGKPITGGDQEGSAPEAKPDVYTDTLQDGKDRWYRIPKTADDSTIWAGALIQAERAVASINSLQLTFVDPATGEKCASEAGSTTGISPVRLHAVSLASTECESASELLLSVNLELESAKELPFRLTLIEEAPALNADSLPEPAEDPKWEEMPPASATGEVEYGAANFGDAPVLEPGSHSVALTEGEAQIYAVDLDWGQRLQVQTDLKLGDRSSVYWSTELISPLGVEAATLETDSYGSSNQGSVSMKATTTDIRYNNRGQIGAAGENALPGRYYILVSGGDPDAIDTKQEEWKGTMQINVVGEAGDGAPEYAEMAAPTTVAPSETSVAADTEKRDNKTQAAEDGPNWPLIGGLGGGALLCAAVGVTAIVLLRKKNAGI
ncbi:vWA domain-containing protein [Gulosibacter hominis]|uniref:vWA domain-containing protein n=1 Tax=Gulosibacter hominis TaxID=2770504 RepID=UPI00191AE626|nr:VWA domain-containing protein [Gulosibacter hominis]